MRPKLVRFLLFPALLTLSQSVFGTAPQSAGGIVTGNVGVWDFDLKVGNVLPRSGLSGAQVFLRKDGQVLETKSNEAGQFRFDDVPAGVYEAFCSIPEPFSRAGPEFQEVTVTPGKTARVNFVARTAGSISGRLLTRSGTPVSGVRVCLGIPEPVYPQAPHVLKTISASGGFFRFSGIPPGRYHLGLRLDPSDPPDLPYPRIYFPGVEDPSQAAVIDLGEGEALANIDLVLPEPLSQRRVAGRVVLPGGIVAASARVVLEITDYPYTINGGETTADALGTFSVPAFNGLTYRIRALVSKGNMIAETQAQPLPKTGPQTGLVLFLLPHDHPVNLLVNPSADRESEGWIFYKESFVDRSFGDPCFAIRNKGYILQDVGLPEGSSGRYALLFGNLETERINESGSITGLPYLYGYMMMSSRGRILAYLEGQQMGFQGKNVGEWQPAYGVFPIPPETEVIRFFLSQAERKGDPQNGSLVRFDDLGLYLFDSQEEARIFVDELRESEWLVHEQAEASPVQDSISPPAVELECAACVTAQSAVPQVRGTVVLKCDVGLDGRASACRVQRGLGRDLDQIAIQVVMRRWHFVPAMQNGRPVAGSILVEVSLIDCARR